MDDVDGSDFIAVFDDLIVKEYITIEDGSILRAGLNPSDSAELLARAPLITNFLYKELMRAAIDFDGIVSIPTGGDYYATRLREIFLEEQSRDIAKFPLRKSSNVFEVDHRTVPRMSRVLVVDDTIYTGDAAYRVTKILERYDCKVAAYLCAAEIKFFGRFVSGTPILSIFNGSSLDRLQRQTNKIYRRRGF